MHFLSGIKCTCRPISTPFAPYFSSTWLSLLLSNLLSSFSLFLLFPLLLPMLSLLLLLLPSSSSFGVALVTQYWKWTFTSCLLGNAMVCSLLLKFPSPGRRMFSPGKRGWRGGRRRWPAAAPPSQASWMTSPTLKWKGRGVSSLLLMKYIWMQTADKVFGSGGEGVGAYFRASNVSCLGRPLPSPSPLLSLCINAAPVYNLFTCQDRNDSGATHLYADCKCFCATCCQRIEEAATIYKCNIAALIAHHSLCST